MKFVQHLIIPIPDKASDLEDTTNLAYRGVMPAALRRAIQKTHVENKKNVSDGGEFVTIYDTTQAVQYADERASLWRAQQPRIALTNALVLGLRRMKPEFRRRVDACKSLRLHYLISRHLTTLPHSAQNTPSQPDHPSLSAKRNCFKPSFTR